MGYRTSLLFCLTLAACTSSPDLEQDTDAAGSAADTTTSVDAAFSTDTLNVTDLSFTSGRAPGNSATATTYGTLTVVRDGLDPRKNLRIVGARGETLLIPANSLLQRDGQPVTGNVSVSFTCALQPGDFFRLNAPTIAKGTLLGSGGSFVVEATSNGEPLMLKGGEAMEVRLPAEPVVLFPEYAMRFFSGTRNGRNLTWSLVPTERIDLVPLCYKFFPLDQERLPGREFFARIDSVARKYPVLENNSVDAPGPALAIGKDQAAIAREALKFYNDPAYKGTFVCTLPFMKRLQMLTERTFSLVKTWNGRQYIDERSGANTFILAALKVYQDHAKDDLFIADSLVAAIVNDNHLLNVETPSAMAIRIRDIRKAYAEFTAQHLGQPLHIDDHGVDLNAPDAFDRLICKGLTMEKANSTLEDYQDRLSSEEGLSQLQVPEGYDRSRLLESWPVTLRDGRKALVMRRQTYVMRPQGFGSFNCDRFIADPSTVPVDVTVTVDGPMLENEQVTLFFPDLNSYVDLQPWGQRSYRLPTGMYRLPPGQRITVMVHGARDGVPQYQFKEERLQKRLNLRMQPGSGTDEGLNAALDRIA